MTVAPSRPSSLPHYPSVLDALQACWQIVHDTQSPRIASLALPLPQVDPLAVLLTLATQEQRQCYWESPSKGYAIAAWEEVLCEEFSGRDRFRTAREYLQTWQQRVESSSTTPEGPYFFCSFSFFDTVDPIHAGFAPATVLLTRWQVVRQQQHCTLIANVLIKPHTMLPPLARTIAEQLSKLKSRSWVRQPASVPRWPSRLYPKLSDQDGQVFQQRVRQTLAAVAANQIQKQVVAYALDITRQHPFSRSLSLPRLRSQHPGCCIFSFSGTNNAHFIGASPERLLSIRQGRLITDALAGSAPRGKTPQADRTLGQQLANSAKEQREHRLVLDFIVQQLQAKGLSPRYSTPPGLLRLSHIQHLHTPICADVPAHVSPLTLVEALHPTPAVAGVPTATACQLIQQTEACDRGLYAAPLGWVDPYKNSDFIVGIRSALIQGNRARLYTGAGIVAGSDPEKELAEVQLKLQALAEALG
ncbi:MAG: isochorismate synthase [Cyanobacteria bacterium J06638_28]